MNKNIEYYNKNGEEFYKRTIHLDLSEWHLIFLENLPKKGSILDAGCGSGRDTQYFLAQGYAVTAFDASQKMVEIASKETGIEVLKSTFQKMQFHQAFDGVWANASLLHVPYGETKAVYKNIHRALKPGGVFYASYKYGNNYMPTVDREFWNMNEEMIKPYFEGMFDVIQISKGHDTRGKVAPNPEGMWLRFVVKKKMRKNV